MITNEMKQKLQQIDFRHRTKEDNELCLEALNHHLQDYSSLQKTRIVNNMMKFDIHSIRDTHFILHVLGERIDKPNLAIPLGPRKVARSITNINGAISYYTKNKYGINFTMSYAFKSQLPSPDIIRARIPIFSQFFRFGRLPKELFLKKFNLPENFDMKILDTEFPYGVPEAKELLGELALRYKEERLKIYKELPRNSGAYTKVYEFLFPGYPAICIPVGQKITVTQVCKPLSIRLPFFPPARLRSLSEENKKMYDTHIKFRPLSPLEYVQKYGDTDIYGNTIIRFNVQKSRYPGTYDDRTPKRRTDEECN